MSTYERDRLDVNGDVVNLRDAGSVRFDRAQSLTAAQQAQARGNIGLGNVDNTSDADKPVSTAQQAALAGKADSATTLAGYGIVNAYTKTETDDLLDEKQEALTFDTQPTEGSTNPVTSGGVYDEFEKTVRVTAQTLTEQQKYTARQNIGAISANEVEHKRFGVSGVGLSSPTLTRLYDAVGMTATPSTDTVEGHSDFDAYAPFNRRKCVGSWSVVSGESKATFTVNAYEGDADYAEDGSMGDYVAVEVDPFYYYEKDGVLAVSTYPYSGYKIHPVCCDYDGNIRAHTYIPVYGLAKDGNGKAVSLPGYYTEHGGYNAHRTAAKTYANTDAAAYAMIEPTAVFHYEWLLMTIEYATQDMQSVMHGAASMRYNTSDVIVAAPAANKIVIGATGSNFVIGQTVLFNADHSALTDANTLNSITNIQKCDASGNVDSSGSYYLITYDGTDRTSSIVANSWKMSSRPWLTGATAGYAPGVNAVLGHTGSPVSNTSGKYPMRYRWRENVYANQYRTTLDLADVRVVDGSSYHLDWYYLKDPRLFTPSDYTLAILQDTSKGWVKLGVTTPSGSYVNGYIKEMGVDPDYPIVQVPVLTSGGSASTYYCDYTYLVNSHVVRCVRRGGAVSDGAPAGPLFFHANFSPSTTLWQYGSALYMLQ